MATQIVPLVRETPFHYEKSPSLLEVSEGRRLFIEFLNQFLQVEIYGFQSGFGLKPDLILFRHPTIGGTLAIPTSTMLLPVEQARSLVQNKIAASSASFGLVAQ